MTSYNLSGSFKPCHVLRRGRQILALGVPALCLFSIAISGAAFAKTPGKTYCYKKTCHRVKTLNETKALVGRDVKINASFYDGCSKDRFNSCGLTSSGEVYKPHKADNAASSVLPDGTIALVWSQSSGEAIVLRINNAGPYWGNRKLDLSAAAARKLGMKGVEEVTLRVVKAPTEDEARFEKNRSYDPVIGPLGKFASLDLAQKAMSKIRTDGLKGTPSLANLEEDTIPVSGREVKVASLDESFFISSMPDVKGDRAQSGGAETAELPNISSRPTQSILSPLLKVKDLLSTFKSQMLPSNSNEDLIETDPLEIMTDASNEPQSVQLTDGSSDPVKTEKTSEGKQESSSTLPNQDSHDFKVKAKGSRADQNILNDKKVPRTKGQIKISSVVGETNDKFSYPKSKKKST